jgi:2-iminobutanoate/2-iminopropanoate deaminase
LTRRGAFDIPRAHGEPGVATDQAPKAIGPYSQAIVSGDLVFTSGQIPLDPKTQEIVKGDVRAQAERVMENLRGVLEAAGVSFAQVVKTNIFLAIWPPISPR